MLGSSYRERPGGGRLPGFLPLGLVLFQAHGDWFLSWAFRPVCASEALLVSRERQADPRISVDCKKSIKMEEHGEGNGSPLQYSRLGNPMGRGDWQATVHGVTESDTTW